MNRMQENKDREERKNKGWMNCLKKVNKKKKVIIAKHSKYILNDKWKKKLYIKYQIVT